MKKEEGMKILSLAAENFKNIDKTEVDFAGRSAVIIGKNGAGKSSLIQAICSPVDSTYIPAEPIKKGEERGSIELKIGGNLHGSEESYTLGLYFSEKHKKGRITITNSDGEKVTGGKQLISDIVGNIGFDIQEFIKLGVTSTGAISKPGVQQQIEILKGLMPRDILKKMHDLDQEFDKAYSERTDINKDLSYAKTRLERHEFTQEEIEAYSEAIDTDPIVNQMSNIEKEIETYNKAIVSKQTVSVRIEYNKSIIKDLEEKLAMAKAELAKDEEQLPKIEKWLSGKTKPSIDSLNKELAEANQHNQKVKEIKELENLQKEIRDFESSSEKKTERLSKIKVEKKEIFASSPLPVKDLTFDEEGIYYKGLPFVEGQHPTSTIMLIGMKIGMAMNPNLKLLIIRDGSLLDEKTLKWMLSECEKNGYQIFVEKVADNEEVDIEFIESKQ